ncbi:hypothetical protein BGW38_005606 [Lunasporangiospora selenospora]|uniref:Uncharacterized protein n=1 Tax=Lunasporangiospora selenospora TaxID=979761 RepID=A0A9P6FNM0_9FUNG|nr:hypothetical protein BGW38_005606 [Lunasporangiospora selenospora]
MAQQLPRRRYKITIEEIPGDGDLKNVVETSPVNTSLSSTLPPNTTTPVQSPPPPQQPSNHKDTFHPTTTFASSSTEAMESSSQLLDNKASPESNNGPVADSQSWKSPGLMEWVLFTSHDDSFFRQLGERQQRSSGASVQTPTSSPSSPSSLQVHAKSAMTTSQTLSPHLNQPSMPVPMQPQPAKDPSPQSTLRNRLARRGSTPPGGGSDQDLDSSAQQDSGSHHRCSHRRFGHRHRSCHDSGTLEKDIQQGQAYQSQESMHRQWPPRRVQERVDPEKTRAVTTEDTAGISVHAGIPEPSSQRIKDLRERWIQRRQQHEHGSNLGPVDESLSSPMPKTTSTTDSRTEYSSPRRDWPPKNYLRRKEEEAAEVRRFLDS